MGGKRYVRDLGSRTGTFVNGQPVRQQEVQFGDTVRIGETTMRYESVNGSALTTDDDSGLVEVDEFEDLVGTAPLGAMEFAGGGRCAAGGAGRSAAERRAGRGDAGGKGPGPGCLARHAARQRR